MGAFLKSDIQSSLRGARRMKKVELPFRAELLKFGFGALLSMAHFSLLCPQVTLELSVL